MSKGFVGDEENEFLGRHIGPTENEQKSMLASIGFSSLEELCKHAVPKNIRVKTDLTLEKPYTESRLLEKANILAHKNSLFKNYLGQGYYDTRTPAVIQRVILENPSWYTAYTPYQAEISQGRMEALLYFQTMICEMTKMEVANASLLDEATAAAEAMNVCYAQQGHPEKPLFLVDAMVFEQTYSVLATRAKAIDIEVRKFDFAKDEKPERNIIGALIQYPARDGSIKDIASLVTKIKGMGGLAVVATDLMAITIMTPPGDLGADIVVGSSQRFGVPMMFGGPHAGFMAAKDAYKRNMPGRFIGVTRDVNGKTALRMALQTREQHIKREKATSNICTSQVLLAVMATMYAVYHGPKGLNKISAKINYCARLFANGLNKLGIKPRHNSFFDTVCFEVSSAQDLISRAIFHKTNIWRDPTGFLSVSFDESKEVQDVMAVLEIVAGKPLSFSLQDLVSDLTESVPEQFVRKDPCLSHEVFNKYHTETEFMRFAYRLEKKDLSLNTAMIPLGSCTMKLNSAVEMMPVTFSGFAQLHPFIPRNQADGMHQIITELEQDLAEITGFAKVSLQPNAGSQGEYSGLLVIKKYHEMRQEGHRNICLIPASAHGTNPASAIMAGFSVVVVSCDSLGNIDVSDLKAKAEANAKDLAAIMITYPSTHGVFEEDVREICEIVHKYGGQVYMDGANMNAMVGLAKPGEIGADVLHLNLHKTFAIPHGGGGPGVGPIGVASHLVDFLPDHFLLKTGKETQGRSIGAIAAAPWGSAGILPISWSYIKLMGGAGLKKATSVAILSANYLAKKLSPAYPILYTSKEGLVAHECILDCRPFKKTAGIEVDDIAKRLMDYGFHAPTMSFPVPGTLMVEPTESESLFELDRFCEAMLSIREEIRKIEEGSWPKENNVLKNAPHSMATVTADSWDKSYPRSLAAYPTRFTEQHKYWPTVDRVDNAYGDRNFICICPPMSEYQ